MYAIKGNILFTKEMHQFDVMECAVIVVEDGKICGVFENLPPEYSSVPLTDYGDKLIIPGFVDIHLHAPQYENIGLGYDKELLPWLDTYTFPEEAKFQDVDYAKQVYEAFSRDLLDCGTSRSVVFGTIHQNSTLLLADLIATKGLGAYVGMVNMDRNSPAFLVEDTDDSIRHTIDFVKQLKGKYPLVEPILTPRFVPTCSSSLMKSLGDIAQTYDVKVQSHLSENRGEIEWVKSLHPESKHYGDVYHANRLFGQKHTIMAHCVYSAPDEIELMKQNDVFVAHCPTSNIDLSSGVAPIAAYLNKEINVGLGSDIAGGHTIFMPKVIVSAVQSSKLYKIYVDPEMPTLNMAQCFYLATKGGGKFFGKVGSFEPGYEFDALVIDDGNIKGINKRSLQERLEKFMYNGTKDNICCVYVAGKQVK